MGKPKKSVISRFKNGDFQKACGCVECQAIREIISAKRYIEKAMPLAEYPDNWHTADKIVVEEGIKETWANDYWPYGEEYENELD